MIKIIKCCYDNINHDRTIILIENHKRMLCGFNLQKLHHGE